MCFTQEIMYYLLLFSYKNHFLVQIYVDLFIPKQKSGQLLHACVLEMLIRLIGDGTELTCTYFLCKFDLLEIIASTLVLLPCAITWHTPQIGTKWKMKYYLLFFFYRQHSQIFIYQIRKLK